jgi:hypothetical protein
MFTGLLMIITACKAKSNLMISGVFFHNQVKCLYSGIWINLITCGYLGYIWYTNALVAPDEYEDYTNIYWGLTGNCVLGVIGYGWLCFKQGEVN